MSTRRLVFKKLIKLGSWIVPMNSRYISKISNLLIPNMRKSFINRQAYLSSFSQAKEIKTGVLPFLCIASFIVLA
jgi:hypothetical protein